MKRNVEKIGTMQMVDTKVGTYAIQYTSQLQDTMNFDIASWDTDPTIIAGIRVVPWGPNNNLPTYIRNLLEKNNLGPGILDRKTGLLYGQGPLLYRVKIKKSKTG